MRIRFLDKCTKNISCWLMLLIIFYENHVAPSGCPLMLQQLFKSNDSKVFKAHDEMYDTGYRLESIF
jgi:hypothetical protein